MYRCGFCNKDFDRLEDRIKCETHCLEEYKKAEEEKRANEYQEKRKESANAIYAEFDRVEKMIKEHVKQFNSLALTKQYPYLKYVFDRSLWWF
jgi:hypothetical protein